MAPRSTALVAIVAALLASASAVAGPTGTSLWRVLTLQDYNTRVVVIGAMLLGIAAGIVGTYMLLRKRALVGDALSHATLPGIALAFLVMSALGGSGKALPGLLLGAVASGLLGVGAITLITRFTRIRQDAALGIVLSVSFGIGIALLSVIQRLPTGNQAGLESFIYGKTASMVQADALLLGGAALVAIVACIALYKEFAILSFDAEYAAAQGWPSGVLDAVMMTLVTVITVVGLQAVGLILIIAMLIIPPAAARFWTDHLRTMLLVSAAIGALSGLVGASISALVANMPAGAIIVVTASAVFAASLVLGTKRGVAVRLVRHARLRRTMGRQHLLRALYEWLEAHDALPPHPLAPISRHALLAARSWSRRRLHRVLRRAERSGLVRDADAAGLTVTLTERGVHEAARVVRNHRLWELFLITHAEIAPSHVDRDADQIEHVLHPEMVHELEALLAEGATVPPSPHSIRPREVAT